MHSFMTLAVDYDWSDDATEVTRSAADFLRSGTNHGQIDSGVYPIPAERHDTIPALPLWMSELEEEVA